MKKRIISFAALLAAASMLASCSESPSSKTNALINEIVSDAAAAQTTPVKTSGTPVTTTSDIPETLADSTAFSGTSVQPDDMTEDEPVAVDLTKMTSTMVYSVIYDIMTNADRYYGRTILLDGFFDTSLDEKYYFVVVPDATACCMQGLEFKLDDSKIYPNDYPEKKADIRIRGTLDRYMEDGMPYCYIKADWVRTL